MPMLLKVYHKLLQSPGTEQKHPFCKKLQLVVAYLSDVSKWKDCRQASMMSSWNHGDQCKSSLQQTSAEMVGILWKMGLPSPTSSCNWSPRFYACFVQTRLGYSAINSHRSDLSSILQVPGVERIGEHILVFRFMKGVFNLRTPQPRYSKMWDINKVLIYLKGLGRNEDWR